MSGKGGSKRKVEELDGDVGWGVGRRNPPGHGRRQGQGQGAQGHYAPGSRSRDGGRR